MEMQVTKFFLVVLAFVGVSSIAIAQTGNPTLVKKYKDWGAYTVSDGGSKICYVMTEIKDKSPKKLNHGEVYLFVTARPESGGKLEISFVTGYSFKSESKVNAVVDGQNFVLMTQGDAAWVEEATQENVLVDAMRAGQKMEVSALSGRGNKTRYRVSLSGITAALKRIGSGCP
jgi:invasion protein IalB